MTPSDIRKLIALFAGIIFMFIGIVMVFNQIQATGSIDLSTTIISGKIQSGSAGLFICFLSIILILFSILPGKIMQASKDKPNSPGESEKPRFLISKMSRGLLGIVIVWIIFFIMMVPVLFIPGFSNCPAKDGSLGYPAIPIFYFLAFCTPSTITFFYYYIKRGEK
jgi:ABC-type Fe3+ transport system permease subunit